MKVVVAEDQPRPRLVSFIVETGIPTASAGTEVVEPTAPDFLSIRYQSSVGVPIAVPGGGEASFASAGIIPCIPI
jgi:hypothetical protein